MMGGRREIVAPVDVDWMPLYQQLFLLAHDRDGQPRIKPAALNLALAGAVMADLVLAECIQIRDDRWWVLTMHRPHPDPLANAITTAALAAEGPKYLSHWLRVLAGGIHDRVSAAGSSPPGSSSGRPAGGRSATSTPTRAWMTCCW